MATPGTLDTTFGNAGKFSFAPGNTIKFEDTFIQRLGSGGTFQAPTKMGVTQALIQPDGKTIAVFTGAGVYLPNGFSNPSVYALGQIVRFNVDGSVDSSFGNGGKISAVFGKTTGIITNGVTLQSDGKLLVHELDDPALAPNLISSGGTQYNYRLSRYNTDGTRDSSFGNGGSISTNLLSDFQEINGKIYTSGSVITYQKPYGAPVIEFPEPQTVSKYNLDGTLDTTFGNGGSFVQKSAETSFGRYEIPFDLLPLQDGKLLIGWSVLGSNAHMTRYNADGTVDTTFGTNGDVAIDGSVLREEADLIQLKSGKLLLIGNSKNENNNLRIKRYNDDGSLDPTFSFYRPFSLGTIKVIEAADGKLTIAERSSGNPQDFQLTRLNPDGSDDSSYSNTVTQFYGNIAVPTRRNYFNTDFNGNDDIPLAVAFDEAGNIIIAGYSTPVNGGFASNEFSFSAVRYLNDLSTVIPQPTNQAPVVANAIADQNATIGTAFNFAVPANTFSDPDVGNTLTYSATLADGTALPAWLVFDAATKTFSGTPPTGTSTTPLALQVKATDNGGLSITDDFNITIAAGVTPPPTSSIQKITSTPTGGASDGDSGQFFMFSGSGSISGDGRYVLYGSSASNLVAGDTNNKQDIFLYDRTTNTNKLLEGGDNRGGISRNSLYVAYVSKDSANKDVLAVYDTVNQTTSQISSTVGIGMFGSIQISNDGRYISVYTGGGVSLVDRTANTVTVVPKLAGTSVGLNTPEMSPTGSFFLYTQYDYADNTSPINGTYRYDITTGQSTKISNSDLTGFISADGLYAYYNEYVGGVLTAKKIDLTTNVVSAGNAELLGVSLGAFTASESFVRISEDGQYRLTLAGDASNIIAGDTNGFKDLFIASVTATPANQAPVVSTSIADQNATVGTAFNFAVPSNAFSDPNSGDILTYTATLADSSNSPLPSWLTFNAATKTFTGTPPTGTGNLNLRVQATDNGGLSVTDDFTLTIASGATGGSNGDPHISTFDGFHYDFQATGDFTLVLGLNSDLNIQVRQTPWALNPNATINTALATVVDGNRVEFYIDQPLPLIDNLPLSLAVGESLALGKGSITRTAISGYGMQGDLYTITYPNGDVLKNSVFSGFLMDPNVTLANGHQVVGLLGSNNGNSQDDLALRDGTILANPLAPENLYGAFAQSWQVMEQDSLFRSTAVNPSDPLSTSSSLQALAQQYVLGGNGDDTLIGSKTRVNLGEDGVDLMMGNKGADTFVLGDKNSPYYVSSGLKDYALITDLWTEDRIQLHGISSDYVLGSAPVGLANGTGIFLAKDPNELVAIVQDRTISSLDLNNASTFHYI